MTKELEDFIVSDEEKPRKITKKTIVARQKQPRVKQDTKDTKDEEVKKRSKPVGPNADPKKAKQIIENIGAILVQLKSIIDPSMVMIPTGVGVVMSCQNHEGIKDIFTKIYRIIKESFKKIFKCKILIIEGIIQTSAFEIRIDADIHQVLDRGSRRVIKHRSLDKTLYTDNYYEACFVSFLCVFWEVAIHLLDFRPTNVIKLNEFLEKYLLVTTNGLSYEKAFQTHENIAIKNEEPKQLPKVNEMDVKVQPVTIIEYYNAKMEENQTIEIDDEYNYNQLFLKYCSNKQSQN